MDLKAVLTLYGPLAMGWVVAWVLWQENKRLAEKWIEKAVEDIELKSEMTHKLTSLTEKVIEAVSS